MSTIFSRLSVSSCLLMGRQRITTFTHSLALGLKQALQASNTPLLATPGKEQDSKQG